MVFNTENKLEIVSKRGCYEIIINNNNNVVLQAVFKNYDHDKDGFISHAEFDAIAGNFPFIDSFAVLDADQLVPVQPPCNVFVLTTLKASTTGVSVGRLKTRDWKMQDWKTREHRMLSTRIVHAWHDQNVLACTCTCTCFDLVHGPIKLPAFDQG